MREDVTRSWTLTTLIDANRGQHSPPWTCQLIRAEADESSFVLDLVALEPCPVDALGCPRFTPFTMNIVKGTQAKWNRWGDDLTAWVDAADMVTIMAGESEGVPWLCLSTPGQQHLILELPARGQWKDGRPPA
jgi:hypothetical protein